MADKLGKYEISGILGKGAMGTVYDARDPVIDRRVAIKTITLPDPDDHEAQEELARFNCELEILGIAEQGLEFAAQLIQAGPDLR